MHLFLLQLFSFVPSPLLYRKEGEIICGSLLSHEKDCTQSASKFQNFSHPCKRVITTCDRAVASLLPYHPSPNLYYQFTTPFPILNLSFFSDDSTKSHSLFSTVTPFPFLHYVAHTYSSSLFFFYSFVFAFQS